MTYDEIRNAIFSDINKILELTQTYLSAPLPQNQVFSEISDTEIKKEYSRYRNFTVTLLHYLSSIDTSASELSLLIATADKEMDNSQLLQASLLFDRFCAWRKTLTEILSNNDKLFTKEKKNFKRPLLISNTQKFYECTKFLKGSLQ